MSTGVRVYWEASDSSEIVQYEVRRSTTAQSAQVVVTNVAADVPGPNWNAATSRFFYDDFGGDTGYVYQVLGLSSRGIVLADTGLFRPDGSSAAGLDTRVPVDHNYGADDAYRYVTSGGAGVPGAIVRAYRKPDFDAGRRDLATGVTETDDDGRWVTPIYLEPGMTYVLTFCKDGVFGPDKREVVV